MSGRTAGILELKLVPPVRHQAVAHPERVLPALSGQFELAVENVQEDLGRLAAPGPNAALVRIKVDLDGGDQARSRHDIDDLGTERARDPAALTGAHDLDLPDAGRFEEVHQWHFQRGGDPPQRSDRGRGKATFD